MLFKDYCSKISLKIVLVSYLLFLAEPAFAVQVHGGLEGLVSHQVGHILFASGMLFLLVIGHVNNWHGAGWSRFRCFLGLTVLWNVITFAGHWLRLFVDDGKFVRIGGKTVGFRIESFWDFIFYIANLDHLVLLPALICLTMALRQWHSLENIK